MMNIQTLHIALAFLAALPALGGETPLFRMTSHAGAPAGWNQPAMVFQETERRDTWSTVEAVQVSGSAAAKSMFLLRGSCALMKERNKQGFVIVPLSRQPVRFAVQFVSDEKAGGALDRAIAEGAVTSAARCELVESMLAR